MSERIVSYTHIWDLAAMIRASSEETELACERGYLWVVETRVAVLDAICEQCRRSYAQVGHIEHCSAADNNDHLIGGRPGIRAKRNHGSHNCELVGCDRTESLRRAIGWKPGD